MPNVYNVHEKKMLTVASFQTSAIKRRSLMLAAQHKLNDDAQGALRVTFRAVGLAIEL